MDILKIRDKTGKEIHLSEERWKHILKHPQMDENQLENIKRTIINPMIIKFNEDDSSVKYFYTQFKQNKPEEKYLLVAIKYLNGSGFITTSFFTNKTTCLKWETK